MPSMSFREVSDFSPVQSDVSLHKDAVSSTSEDKDSQRGWTLVILAGEG